jgi:[NiFe] hydrogenase assembly HybE family chaperone
VIQECNLTQGLETAFRTIHEERMAGLPILNPVLQVQAVGFRDLNDRCAGVLITPWLMNLLLLPPQGDSFSDAGVGDKLEVRFPSGPCEMELCEEELLGRYLSRPLFSPMGEFRDQQQAVTTAESIMQKLMTPVEPAQPEPEPGRRALLRGLFSTGQG